MTAERVVTYPTSSQERITKMDHAIIDEVDKKGTVTMDTERKRKCGDDDFGNRKLARLEENEESFILDIEKLPLSVILHVFSFLSLYDLLHCASEVCKLWRRLTYDPSLWKYLKLRKYPNITDEILLSIVSRSQRVQLLDISDLRNISPNGLCLALKKCTHLQTLKMLRTSVPTEAVFSQIVQSCKKLQQLHLEVSTISNSSLSEIASSCHELESLSINQCSMVSDESITTVARNCPKLQQISMDQCSQVTDAGMKALLEHCPRLQAISCMSCNLTDKGVSYLAKAKELRVMEVCNIKSLTNKSIIHVVTHCTQLERINVSLCTNINDDCIDHVAHHAKKLKKIYLVSCDLTDKALVALGTHCKTISSVDVGWCKRITNHGVEAISKICPSLTFLGLMRCDRVSIHVTESLVEKYPHITYSTMWLDCKRLIERARREGFQLPSISQPPVQNK